MKDVITIISPLQNIFSNINLFDVINKAELKAIDSPRKTAYR